MYILSLAWRYACARWVNAVAVAAVALCVMVQIVVMAVLDGQLDFMKQRVRNMGEQISVLFAGDEPTRAEFETAAQAVAGIPGVLGVTPVVRSYGLLEARGYVQPVRITGIDLAREASFSQLPDHLLHLRVDRAHPSWRGEDGFSPERPGLFVGKHVADQLGLAPPAPVRLVYQERGREGFERMHFVASSAFQSGSPVDDQYGVFIPLEAAQAMAYGHLPEGQRDRVGIFSVWIKDLDRADELAPVVVDTVARALRRPYPPESQTWQQRWHDLASGMAHENMLQEVILVLMNLSGGFCVFAILATLVSRRVRDVGLLRCIGATRQGVMAVFLVVGLLVGVAGSVIGVAGGLLLTSHTSVTMDDGMERVAPRIDAYWETLTGSPLYPPRMFGIHGAKGLPVLLTPWKIVAYAVGATLISVLAAAYPALWAGHVEPVEALHDE